MVLSPLYALVNDSESSPRPPHNASVILQQRTFVITTFLDIVHFDLISSSLFRQVTIVLNLIYSWFSIYRSFASRCCGWSIWNIYLSQKDIDKIVRRDFFFFFLFANILFCLISRTRGKLFLDLWTNNYALIKIMDISWRNSQSILIERMYNFHNVSWNKNLD